MDQLSDFSDVRLRSRCVYCGGPTESRDHVPSKVLLDEPYPGNLPVVLSCERCNSGFSLDEEYVACLIDCALVGSVGKVSGHRDKIQRILRDKPALAARLEQQIRTADDGQVHFLVDPDRARAVALKLARGHAAYEQSDPHLDEPSRVWIGTLPQLSAEARTRFETVPQLVVFPEVGSRAMQRVLVVSQDVFNDWIEVQPERYRYLSWVDDNSVGVRIVLSEFVACEVVWTR